MNIKTIIISRSRFDTIVSDKLFPNAVITCPESQVEDYRKTVENEIIPHPDYIIGLGLLRNWVMEKFKEEIIVMVDDDVVNLSIIGRAYRRVIETPEIIQEVVENTAVCAKDMGARVFGFNQCWDTRKYQANKPFLFNKLVGGVIGIIGKDLTFDATKKYKVDGDFCLESLRKDRIIWTDSRYSFEQIRNRNKGGNSLFRTFEERKKEIDELRKKWGRYLVIKEKPTGESFSIKVKR